MCVLATADCNCNTIVRDYESTGMGEVPGRNAGFHIGTGTPEYVADYTHDAKGRMGSVDGPGLGAAAEYAYVTDSNLPLDRRHAAHCSSCTSWSVSTTKNTMSTKNGEDAAGRRGARMDPGGGQSLNPRLRLGLGSVVAANDPS